jgi:hypothetical protein
MVSEDCGTRRQDWLLKQTSDMLGKQLYTDSKEETALWQVALWEDKFLSVT